MSAPTLPCAPADADLQDFLTDYRRVSRAFHDASLSPRELADWRARRLTTVLHHVTERSPFYRRHLAGTDITAVTPDTLNTLPFTTKDDLRREMYDVLSGPLSAASIYYETNGTTGAATPCPRGAVDIATSNASVEESWRRLFRAHFGDRMPVVGLMGPSELYAFGDVFTDVAASLGACHVKIWPESPGSVSARPCVSSRSSGSRSSSVRRPSASAWPRRPGTTGTTWRTSPSSCSWSSARSAPPSSPPTSPRSGRTPSSAPPCTAPRKPSASRPVPTPAPSTWPRPTTWRSWSIPTPAPRAASSARASWS